MMLRISHNIIYVSFAVLLTLVIFSARISAHTHRPNDYCASIWGDQNFDCSGCASLWEKTTLDIRSDEYATYRRAVEPYFNASDIMYNYRYNKNATLEGWDLVNVHYPSQEGHYGMHAIAWRHHVDTWRVLVAIRGTWDVAPWQDEQWADICAGWYLLRYMARPAECDRFTDTDMDYYAQLEAFIHQLRRELSGDICLSFTGHSLGSLLSSAMSVAWGGAMPGYSFSGPGLAWMAQHVIPLPQDLYSSRNVHIIYNKYDPIVEAQHVLSNQTGWLMCYNQSSASVSQECRRCVDDGVPLDYTHVTEPCNVCSVEEHETYVLQAYIFSQRRVPDSRKLYQQGLVVVDKNTV